MCSLKAECKQAWGFGSFAKRFVEITVSVAPKAWNIQVSPSVKSLHSCPSTAHCSLPGSHVPLFKLEATQSTNNSPKILSKSVAVRSNATVKLFQIFGLIPS